MTRCKIDLFLCDVINAYLSDKNITDISANDVMVGASCRYRDNRIFVKNDLMYSLVSMHHLYREWNCKFSRSAAIFTILYSVRKQHTDFPEFWIIQELDNRVYPIVQSEFNPLILNAINNSQFIETILALTHFNDIEAFEHFLNEPTIKPHLHGDSTYHDIIDSIGDNMEFRVVLIRVWYEVNSESESERFRL